MFSLLGQSVDWLRLHQGLFLVWGVLTGLHVLARFIPAMQLTFLAQESRPRVAGRSTRLGAVAVTGVIAVVSAVLVFSAIGSWRDDHHGHGPDRHFSFPGQPGSDR